MDTIPPPPTMDTEQQAVFDKLQACYSAEPWATTDWYSSDSGMDKYTIYRFLAGQNFNFDKSKELLDKHLSWRKEYLPVSLTPDIIIELQKKKTYIEGVDKEGTSVVVFRSDRFDPDRRDVAAAVRSIVYLAEKQLALCPKSQQKFGIVWSRVGTTSKNMDLEFVKAMAAVFQDNYPERLKYVVIYPANILMMSVWAIVSRWLAPKTVEKIIMAYSPEALLEKISADQLSERFGGTRPTDAAEEEVLAIDISALPSQTAEDTVTIAAGKSHEAAKMIVAEGSEVSYEIKLEDKDIDVAVTFRSSLPSSEDEAIQSQRVDSSAAYSGTYKATASGQVTVVLSNSFSWMTSKKVSFRVERK